MPHVPFRKVLNTQLYVLITGVDGAIYREGSNGHQKAPPTDGLNDGTKTERWKS